MTVAPISSTPEVTEKVVDGALRAIARYGLSQHRRLQADHRALLAEQVDRRKQERNGQH